MSTSTTSASTPTPAATPSLPREHDDLPAWDPIPEEITRENLEELHRQCHDASMILTKTLPGNCSIFANVTHYPGHGDFSPPWTCVRLVPQFDCLDEFDLGRTADMALDDGPVDVITPLVKMCREAAAAWNRAAMSLRAGHPIKEGDVERHVETIEDSLRESILADIGGE